MKIDYGDTLHVLFDMSISVGDGQFSLLCRQRQINTPTIAVAQTKPMIRFEA